MVAIALLLAGCRAEGRIEILAEDSVTLDVTLFGQPAADCTSDLSGLIASPAPDDRGEPACRYHGTVDPIAFRWMGRAVAMGEYIAVVYDGWEASDVWSPQPTTSDSVDITLVFPGRIVETNGGSASGNELRLTDAAGLSGSGGLRVVALAHPGPALWVWWVTGGVLLGVLASLGVLWWGSRRAVDRDRGVAGADEAAVDADEATLGAGEATRGAGGPPTEPGTPSGGTGVAAGGSGTPPGEADEIADRAFRPPGDAGEIGDRAFRPPGDSRGGTPRPPDDPSRWAPDGDR